MKNKWLVHFSYDSPDLAESDPERITFEQDKANLDEYFLDHRYNILSINITQEKSSQLPGRPLYIVGKDFFYHLNVFLKVSNPSSIATQSDMLEMYDRVVMGLRCIKDVAQQIGTNFYIKPHALRLKALLEQMGYIVITKSIVSEGGLFLKGTPSHGAPFLIVSHRYFEPFKKLKIETFKSPPNIGVDSYDNHIDTYLGIINFKEEITIEDLRYNGILYVHSETLEKIYADSKKQKVWEILKKKMEQRAYFIREYEPETRYQNIGINFKFDRDNHILLSNAFPEKEQSFL
jgi:hypothetical protein